MSVLLSRAGFMEMSPLLVAAAMFLAREFKKLLTTNPTFPVLSIGTIKGYIEQGASREI